MIDVIAQSGCYPPGATKLADLVVEGEQRYWVARGDWPGDRRSDRQTG